MSIHPFVRNPESAVDDIECGLLGILLFKPDCISEVSYLLRPEMFFYQVHNIIYEVLSRHFKQGRKHTIHSIEPHICDGLFSDTKEKREYLGRLLASFVCTSQARDYARSIVEFYNERQIKFIKNDPSLTEPERAERMAILWREIGKPEGTELIALGSALQMTLDDIEKRYRAGGGLAGISTGITDLDDTICGLERSNLYVLAGRPSMGKTALGLTIAINAALKSHPVLFFSLEMSASQLAHRVNARFSKNNMWAQRTARNVDFVSLMETRNDLSNVPLTIVDKSGLTAEAIAAKACELCRKIPHSLIVIDHLAIVAARDQAVPRVHQVSEMTMIFKAMAKELDIPVILLHQLNRGVEGRDDKRPGLADLRDSGSIEQDADAVMMIYRKEYYLENREPSSPNEVARWQQEMELARNMADLIVVKNRQGITKTVPLRFDRERQVFEGLSRANGGFQ